MLHGISHLIGRFLLRPLNIISLACAMGVSLSITTLAADTPIPVKTIGIVVPLEHTAMTEIVDGFKTELARQYPHPVNIIVKNAEHDPTLERTIIKQFQAQNVDIIEPIGEDAFRMTLAATSQPIIGIAAKFTPSERAALPNKNVTNVEDELDPAIQLAFIQKILPNLHKLTIVHSADDKIFSEVSDFIQAAQKLGISVQDLTVAQVPDLYTISQHIDRDSQGIFVLKDHPIVGGMATLAHQAEAQHIPIFASDDGSVQAGAALALGIKERQIGEMAAKLTAQALNGKPISAIPTALLTNYQVFINPQHAAKQNIVLSQVQQAAAQAHYPVIIETP